MYFFGSIHVGLPDFYPLPASVQSAFDACENLVVELDVLSVNPVEVLGPLQKYLYYPGGDSLENHISEELKEKLIAVLEEYGLPWDQMRMMKPAGIDMILSQFRVESLTYGVEYGVDLHLLNQAHEKEKSILELEGIEIQIAVLGSIPEDAQTAMLQATLDGEEDQPAEIQELVEAWRRGDTEMFDSITRQDYLEDPALSAVYEILYSRRNISMADHLRAMIEQGGTYFVVVGVAHFSGEGSVIELLMKSGCTITPVKY